MNNGNEAHRKKRAAAQDLINSDFGDAIIAGPVDMERRLEATTSFRRFCEIYGSKAFTLDWSPYHLDAIDKIERCVRDGSNFALAMPRGSGKSTLCHWAMLWCLMTGQVDYAVYVGATSTASNRRIENLKKTLRFNNLLYQDFPEIIGPIRFVEGEPRRAKGQKWNGESTSIEWGSEQIVFATLPDLDEPWMQMVDLAFGAILDVASIESGSLRGRAFERQDGTTTRPRVVVCDDPQTRESAASEGQCDKREAIIKGDIQYMGGPDELPTAIVIPCTVVYQDDLAHRLLDHKRNPEYKGSLSKMLSSMPGEGQTEDMQKIIHGLWDEYDEKRQYDLLNDTTFATEFYIENKETMILGAEASWKQRFYKDKGEIDAVQSAMNLKLANEEAFYAEAQNEPQTNNATDIEPLRPDDILARTFNVRQKEAPDETDTITSFIDISRNVLWYVTIAWQKGSFSGTIIDYGVYPEQTSSYTTLQTAKRTIPALNPDLEYTQALNKTLDELVEKIASTKYKTESGEHVAVSKIGIDSGWGEHSVDVYKFCRRSTHSNLLLATKGFGITPLKKFLVDPEAKRKPRENVFGQWKIKPTNIRTPLLEYDTNFWKSKVDRLFRSPVGAAGSLSIYGRTRGPRKPNHRMLSEQLTSETSAYLESAMRKVEVWSLKPGRDNHLLDCVVGCSVLCHVLGGNLTGKKQVAKNKTSHKRRSKRRISFD